MLKKYFYHTITSTPLTYHPFFMRYRIKMISKNALETDLPGINSY